jgi:hypothetical protein
MVAGGMNPAPTGWYVGMDGEDAIYGVRTASMRNFRDGWRRAGKIPPLRRTNRDRVRAGVRLMGVVASAVIISVIQCPHR